MNPHQPHPTSIRALFASLLRHRLLILQMAKREVVGRYRGSVMGLVWSLFNPLLMLTIYTFVFSVVFEARWGVGNTESKSGFAVVLFVGMIIFGMFSECINRAPSLILSNLNYVKKVVFPLEIVPWVAMGSALFHMGVSLVVLAAAQIILGKTLPWTFVLFPVIVLPLVLATIGFAWFLAATGVFMRDIAQITAIVTTMLMFLAPVFYPLSQMPPQYQRWLFLNPLTFTIESSRSVLLWGQMPDWFGLLIYYIVSLTICWFGFWWFQKTRKGFADVL